MKTLETLIPDIYEVLDGLNSDKGIDISEELMEDFLYNMKDALEGWSTPHLQSKTIRMSNVGRPLRRVWYDMKDTDSGSSKKTCTLLTLLSFCTVIYLSR